jgi:AraC-like DNA-binding protein
MTVAARSQDLWDTDERQSRRVLAEANGIEVADFRCRAHVHGDGEEEANELPSIVFVRRGVFRRTIGRAALLADANLVLFFNAGEAYRVAHPVAGGDDCTILSLRPAAVRCFVAPYLPGAAETPGTPFRVGHALATPEAARLHWDLARLLRAAASALEVEELAAELTLEALRAACGREPSDPARDEGGGPNRGAGSRHRDLAEAAKLVLHERAANGAPLPALGELASALGCSPFHLSRVFHRVAGMSLRAYAGRLRARAAAERLAAGDAADLTALALDLGYADHSHFTHAFRREWGMPPSGFRPLRPRAIRGARRRATGVRPP